MKKFYFISLLGLLLIVSQSGCRKDESLNVLQSKNEQKTSSLESINGYRPDNWDMGQMYYQFISRIKSIKAGAYDRLKSGIPDSPIDQGAWLVETALNNEYGFQNDSIAYERFDSQYFTLDIIGYDRNHIPIVSGLELDSVYFSIEDLIEEQSGQSNYFWVCDVQVYSINSNTVILEVIPFFGQVGEVLNGVLPIGVNPQPFPNPTILRSCIWYNGQAPLWKRIEMKIKGGGVLTPAPGYIFVKYGHFQKSWYISLNQQDNRFWSGTSGYTFVYTDDCNYYLNGAKQVVDENNPCIVDPTLFIGIFEMSFLGDAPIVNGKTWWHLSNFYIYQTVYVGQGN